MLYTVCTSSLGRTTRLLSATKRCRLLHETERFMSFWIFSVVSEINNDYRTTNQLAPFLALDSSLSEGFYECSSILAVLISI